MRSANSADGRPQSGSVVFDGWDAIMVGSSALFLGRAVTTHRMRHDFRSRHVAYAAGRVKSRQPAKIAKRVAYLCRYCRLSDSVWQGEVSSARRLNRGRRQRSNHQPNVRAAAFFSSGGALTTGIN
jgi:hypothetical protein